jgi:hypothetical protein
MQGCLLVVGGDCDARSRRHGLVSNFLKRMLDRRRRCPLDQAGARPKPLFTLSTNRLLSPISARWMSLEPFPCSPSPVHMPFPKLSLTYRDQQRMIHANSSPDHPGLRNAVSGLRLLRGRVDDDVSSPPSTSTASRRRETSESIRRPSAPKHGYHNKIDYMLLIEDYPCVRLVNGGPIHVKIQCSITSK